MQHLFVTLVYFQVLQLHILWLVRVISEYIGSNALIPKIVTCYFSTMLKLLPKFCTCLNCLMHALFYLLYWFFCPFACFFYEKNHPINYEFQAVPRDKLTFSYQDGRLWRVYYEPFQQIILTIFIWILYTKHHEFESYFVTVFPNVYQLSV